MSNHDPVFEHEMRKVLLICGQRYNNMLHETKHGNFVDEFLRGVSHLPITKLNRWLGYIQGMAVASGRTTVEKERNWTRPYLRPLEFGDE